jgi:hypothetical protein
MSRSTVRFSLSLFSFFVGLAASPTRAEVILGPSQFGTNFNLYLRFNGGFPANPATTVNNPNFYQPTLDLSGVGWRLPGVGGVFQSAWSVTMIDSTHFVGAYHVPVTGNMSIGDSINFLPQGSSTVISRTIANLQNVPNLDNSTSDVLLGTLSSPVPANVAKYAIAATAPIQTPMFLYGRQSEVGRNNVSGTQSGIPFQVDSNPAHNEVLDALLYDYDQPGATGATSPDGLPSTVGNDEAYLNAGDSGGPSFILSGSLLQLVGTHAGVASYEDIGGTKPAGAQDDVSYSLDSYLPDYASTIASMIAVPEPSSLALLGFGVCGMAGYLRSRRRRAAS